MLLTMIFIYNIIGNDNCYQSFGRLLSPKQETVYMGRITKMSAGTYGFSLKRKLSLFALFLAFVLVLAACGGNEETESAPKEDDNKAAEQTEKEDEKEDTASESDVREVEHAMGTTTIEGTPERIVTLYQGATDVAVALGVKPVGAVESWLQQPFYEYIRGDLEGTENLGSELQPNLEQIIQLQPDLIIASKVRHEEIYDQLSEIAPTVAHETVFKWKETVELMGEAMGKGDQADQILSDWDSRVADFKEKLGDKAADTEVSIVRFEPGQARIYTQGFPSLVLNDIGLERPENQRVEEFAIVVSTKEGIPQMDADVIFDITNDYNEDGKPLETREEWQKSPIWENLNAVKNDQVYKVDAVTWNMAGGAIAAQLMLDDIYDRFGLEK
jgi:iron complex transport system substrate-binding protein